MSPIPGYVDISDLAKRFKVHYSQAAKYAQQMPHIMVGRSKLIPIAEVEKFTPAPVGNPNFTKKKTAKKK